MDNNNTKQQAITSTMIMQGDNVTGAFVVERGIETCFKAKD